MHLAGDVARLQGVDRGRLAGRTADIHAAHRAAFAQNRRTTGQRVEIRCVPHANSGDGGKSLHGRFITCVW